MGISFRYISFKLCKCVHITTTGRFSPNRVLSVCVGEIRTYMQTHTHMRALTHTHTHAHTYTHTHKCTQIHLYIEKGGNALLRKVGLLPSILLYYKTQTSPTQGYMKYINNYTHTQRIIFENPVLGTGSQLVFFIKDDVGYMYYYSIYSITSSLSSITVFVSPGYIFHPILFNLWLHYIYPTLILTGQKRKKVSPK